ncbi:hypothetical protein Tsubulata_017719 [Turnera subulata]|uniref:Wall-associated receptor kinase galacturonan-binding domain-containing protein n=1 Tax=Turnera subulata TaxID=218843 RepID=A0A9Q0GDV3_9ROSI|nr:hypothetical protein Tsubulata_017719 [Turnera subulata]
MVLQLVLALTLTILLEMQLAIAEAPVAKPGCPDHQCGNISIPYPFGIGPSCYQDKWFQIECNRTANPPRAFLSSIQAEVLEFQLVNGGKVIVKGPIISSGNCPKKTRRVPTRMNLTVTPFMLSTGNLFTAVGCNTQGSVTDAASELIGCKSTCNNRKSSLPYWQGSITNANWLVDKLEIPRKVEYMEYVPVALVWISNFTTETFNRFLYCEDYTPLDPTLTAATGCRCDASYEGSPFAKKYEGSPYGPFGCAEFCSSPSAPGTHFCFAFEIVLH